MTTGSTPVSEAEALRLQALIDSGMAWRLEGAVGRAAYAAIEAGYCMLGHAAHKDYWGNLVPSRTMVEPGSIGSFEYWQERQDDLVWELDEDDWELDPDD
jgi:hypothetical protein